jgi:oligosaccharide repeat unit polymerase
METEFTHSVTGFDEDRRLRASHWRWEREPGWKAFPVLATVAALILIAIPVGLVSGLHDPSLLESAMSDLPSPWAGVLAACLALSLTIIPMIWVITSGVMDLFSFFLFQNALLIAGYFFLGTTAWNLNGSFAPGILNAAPLVILINAIGFTVLLSVTGITCLLARARNLRVSPTHTDSAKLDARIIWLLRITGAMTALILLLPMLHTGVIPLLSNDTEARAINIESDSLRAFYNLGYGLMPVVTAGLVVLCGRKPSRIVGMDGLLVLALLLAELLSGNRLPLAVAFFVSMTLLSMERRFPRPLLLAILVGSMVLYTGFGGLTGLLRTDREQLAQHPVSKSLEQAFTGDNLIDVRDASWVMSRWDFAPLMGKTYLGGLTAILPSGLFPEKKDWHLGLTAVRIVGWNDQDHFGLRVTCFGEAFLNFGLLGVITLGSVMGYLLGTLLSIIHQIAARRPPCLNENLRLVALMQMTLILCNTSDAFSFWAMGAFLLIQWLSVDFVVALYRKNGGF